METFEGKMDDLSIVFTSTLQDFNEAMTSPMLTVLEGQIRLAEEFMKARINIKLAC